MVRRPAFFALLLGTNRISSARNCRSVDLPAIKRFKLTGISARFGEPGMVRRIRALDEAAVGSNPCARDKTCSAERDSFSSKAYPPGLVTDPTMKKTPALGTEIVSPGRILMVSRAFGTLMMSFNLIDATLT